MGLGGSVNGPGGTPNTCAPKLKGVGFVGRVVAATG